MILTYEQHLILQSEGDIKINAVAGSGKTTTIIEYARTRLADSRILYLAFNKSVKSEAIRRFAGEGLWNVKVETAHSMAYRYIVCRYGYQVVPREWHTYELAEILNLPDYPEKYVRYVLAGHIGKLFSCFCNSDKRDFKELDYLSTLGSCQEMVFVRHFYDFIVLKTRELWKEMEEGRLKVTHDFYLKKFQLSEPVLPYDYILFDEGQDASPAILDVFLRQKATKVIVGDVHQQIYGWRYAVNSLQKVDFQDYFLTYSFRFNQDIADLAMAVLSWKKQFGYCLYHSITGGGETKVHTRKAILARTNLGLLAKAIEYAIEKKDIHRIFFEGNINSYAYADNGTSLYDILYLSNGQKQMIRDPMIKEMSDLQELELYSDRTGEFQIGMLIEVVKEYGNRIPDILRAIKEKHVDHKAEAEIIFSTVHRCKGMEYDAIQLVNDFMPEQKLIESNKGNSLIGLQRLIEEINLLYVAVTRTRNSIHIPQLLLPQGIVASEHVYVIRNDQFEVSPTSSIETEVIDKVLPSSEKAYTYEAVRKEYSQAYMPWTVKDDEELVRMRAVGISIRDLSRHFGRSRGAISSRIKKLTDKNK